MKKSTGITATTASKLPLGKIVTITRREAIEALRERFKQISHLKPSQDS